MDSRKNVRETGTNSDEDATASGGVDGEPVVGTPSHPIAAGMGAVLLGGAAGAAVGTAVGPIGTAIGAAVGAVGGALGGDALASSVDQVKSLDQVKEESHWRDNFVRRPYVPQSASYNDYGPAYRYGVTAYARHPGSRFDEVEADLFAGWQAARGDSSLSWEDARHAARDAWDRVHRSAGSLGDEHVRDDS
jgi:hypothetical protein